MKQIFVLFSLLIFATEIFADIYGDDSSSYIKFYKGKSSYIKNIGIDSNDESDKTVISEYPELYNSFATVAMLDSGFYKGHEELKNSVHVFGSKKSTHGTLVAGVIAAEAGNNKGFRGVVNPRKFYAVGKDELPRKLGKYPYQRIVTFIEKTCHIYEVMNMSHELSPLGYGNKKRDFKMKRHLDVLDEYRKVFKKCSNTLFVISAGNNKVDAKKNNGGIHYFWNPIKRSEIYDPLNNVLVVGSHDGGNSKGEYKAIWDYGRSVDIYADGKLGGPKKGKNKYFTSVSGTSLSAPQVSGVAAIVAGIRTYKGSAIKNALIYGQKRQVFKGYKYSKPILNAYRTIKNIKR